MPEPSAVVPPCGEFQSDLLPNGLRVVTVEMPHLHGAEMICYVSVGSRNERQENAGISHFLEHLLFRGTGDFNSGEKLEQAFDGVGGSVNASVDAETTCFFSRFHPAYLDRTVFLFSSLLRRPLFLDVEIERRIILEEALEDLNDKGEIICTEQLIAGLCWPDHPLSLPTVGTGESLAAIHREHLQAHHRAFYAPGNSLVVVAGRVQRDEVVAAVDRHFGDWNPPWSAPVLSPPPAVAPGPRFAWVRHAESQVEVQLAFQVPGQKDVPQVSLKILRRILAGGMSSRLMRRLREELGLVYGVDGNLILFADTGLFSIQLAVAPERMVDTLAETLAVLERICSEPVPGEELARAVSGMLFDLEFSRDQAEELAGRYGWGILAGCLKTLEQERQELLAETPASLLAVTRACLQRDNLRSAVVGPFRSRDRGRFEKLVQAFRTGAV